MSLTLRHNLSAADPLSSISSASASSASPSNTPAVNILISVFNGAATLNRTLDSVWRQTYRNFTLVVVNDGSTDNTSHLLHTWQKKFTPARFYIITNSHNLGLTKSLNIGLRHCQAAYLARLDADDLWLPDKLSKQMAYLTHHPVCGLVGCWYVNRDVRSTRLFKLPVTDSAIRRHIYRLNPFGHSCVIIKRELLVTVGGYDESVLISQDRDLWFRLLPLTSFYNLPSVLCQRQTATGLSRHLYRRQMWQSIKIRSRYIHRHRASFFNYIFLILPLLIMLQPSFLKKPSRASKLPACPSASNSLNSLPYPIQLCIINDRPLIPHRGETIARQAMAASFTSHPSLAKVTVINTYPYLVPFVKLPTDSLLLYLRCGSLAAAAIALRYWFSPRILMLEIHNFSLPNLSFLAVQLYRLAARRFDLFVTVDPVSTRSWGHLGVKPSNIIELPSGASSLAPLSSTEKIAIRKNHRLPTDRFLAVYSGNLYRDRGLELIFHAATALRSKPIHFVLAGGSPADLAYWRRFIQRVGRPPRNITLLGLLPHLEVLHLLAAADLILVTYSQRCPTINTMSPLKFYEALASRRSILAADFPRLRSAPLPANVYFYQPDNPHDFTANIISVQQAAKAPAVSIAPLPLLTWSDRADRILKSVLP